MLYDSLYGAVLLPFFPPNTHTETHTHTKKGKTKNKICPEALQTVPSHGLEVIKCVLLLISNGTPCHSHAADDQLLSIALPQVCS